MPVLGHSGTGQHWDGPDCVVQWNTLGFSSAAW